MTEEIQIHTKIQAVISSFKTEIHPAAANTPTVIVGFARTSAITGESTDASLAATFVNAKIAPLSRVG